MLRSWRTVEYDSYAEHHPWWPGCTLTKKSDLRLINSHILASQIKRNVWYTLVEQIFSTRLMNRRRFRLLAPTLMTFTGQVMIPPIPFSAPTLILPTHSTYPSVHEWTPPFPEARKFTGSIGPSHGFSSPLTSYYFHVFPEISRGWSAGRIWFYSLGWKKKKKLKSTGALCETINDLDRFSLCLLRYLSTYIS